MSSLSLAAEYAIDPTSYFDAHPMPSALQRVLVGAILTELAERGDMSGEKLAWLAGYDRSTVHAMLSGRRQSTLRVWSDLFDALRLKMEVASCRVA